MEECQDKLSEINTKFELLYEAYKIENKSKPNKIESGSMKSSSPTKTNKSRIYDSILNHTQSSI